MDKQRDNKCYLHVERVDDKFIVVDGLGRQVAMTRNIDDEVTEINFLTGEFVRPYSRRQENGTRLK